MMMYRLLKLYGDTRKLNFDELSSFVYLDFSLSVGVREWDKEAPVLRVYRSSHASYSISCKAGKLGFSRSTRL
jgi:hypothetical protein